MPKTLIKFCGITRVQDAIDAGEIGADFVGMVLHANSPRTIDLATARQIVAALPALTKRAGLFVNAPLQLMLDMASELQLSVIQLHGQESRETVSALAPATVWKAIPVHADSLARDVRKWRDLSNLHGLLMETSNASQAGGTGIENDWNAIAAAQINGAFDHLPPIIAAGGLTPHNVGKVVQKLHPYAVDVSSGIESSKGIKSRGKMQAFFDAVQGVDLT
jgi:phosphoribosylanthranilate isomerase